VDLVLTDMQMPGGSGLDLLRYLRRELPQVAALVVTGVDDPAIADEALSLGAYGYIIKPFRKNEVLIGVSNALRRMSLEVENRAHRAHLEDMVRLRTADLRATVEKLELSEKRVRVSRAETLERLAVAGEFHDEDTGSHVARMSRYCEVFAERCGEDQLRRTIREASSLHDVGKIGIPDGILMKPGPLLPAERVIMQGHPLIGYGILKDSESSVLRLAADIALTHHERVDGSGYPNHLAGNEIPLAGRIAAIADVFDALTSKRVYRPAFSVDRAVEMMKKGHGTQFDPDLLSLFWDLLPGILALEDGPRSVERSLSRV
jgi:putative two-component system response regulator